MFIRRVVVGVAIPVLMLASVSCGKLGKETGPMIKDGSKVAINYTLTVDGRVVDSSEGKEPLSYTQGSGQIIPGLEEQLKGLAKGEKKTVEVPPAKGYGERNDAAVQKVPRSSFKDGGDLEVGMMVSGQAQDQNFQAKVIEVGDKDVTLDLNHPLAGKTLNFEVEVVEVN